MRPFQQAAQEIRGSLHIGILAVLNTSPQRHAFVALASERIEIAVIVHQAEEWPAQDFRQRQVRLRQNRKPQQVQAILHADMVEQLQPVCARDRQAHRFQRPDHRIEQTARPSAHQYQNVLGLHRPAHP